MINHFSTKQDTTRSHQILWYVPSSLKKSTLPLKVQPTRSACGGWILSPDPTGEWLPCPKNCSDHSAHADHPRLGLVSVLQWPLGEISWCRLPLIIPLPLTGHTQWYFTTSHITIESSKHGPAYMWSLPTPFLNSLGHFSSPLPRPRGA